MDKQQLLNQLNNDLQVCKSNKKEGINITIKMLNALNGEIDTFYNLGCITEAIIKSHFNNDIINSSPKGVNDLNINLSNYNIKKYFNGVKPCDIDIKFINNYSTAHKPLQPKILLCITPRGAIMVHSDTIEYNKTGKIILSSVYSKGLYLEALTKKLGL